MERKKFSLQLIFELEQSWIFLTWNKLLLTILDLQTQIKAPQHTGIVLRSGIECYSAKTRCEAFFSFWCKLNSEPEICVREWCRELNLLKQECAMNLLRAHQRLRLSPSQNKNWATGCVHHNEATKSLNPLKYKTPDILKMLAAKRTLLQF